MFEYLAESLNNKTLLSVYTNKEKPARFEFGFALAFENDFLLIASIAPFGHYDGFFVQKSNAIYRIERNSAYAHRVERLYKALAQQHPAVERTTGNPVTDLLCFAQSKNLVVSIELLDSGNTDVQGFVKEVQGFCVVIRQLDDDGRCDGESVIDLQDITYFSCDSDRGMALKLLADYSEKK